MTATTMTSPTPILIERRFPVDLTHSIESIRDLYDAGKKQRWDPVADVPWSSFDPSAYDAATLDAARLTWSRRAWAEYTGLSETPALLIRFCLELGREADPKYFLTVRNTEEAWHIEACLRFAEASGGYIESPANEAYAELFNQGFHKRALDADYSLDAYVATHCAFEDGLELALWRGFLDNATDPAARRILELCVEDKKRHAAFGWFYMEKRATEISADDKAMIGRDISTHLSDVEFRGYHCAWMALDDAAAEIVAADIMTAEMGLGALAPEAERRIVADYIDIAREKFAVLGIDLAPVDIPLAAR